MLVAPNATAHSLVKQAAKNYSMIKRCLSMMYYSIKSVSTESKKVEQLGKKKSVSAQLEEIFYKKYLKATTEEKKLKYLKYFNHVVAMRNKLEFGL
jgi:hypothetical protein